MTTVIADPPLTIRNLLSGNWNSANTSSVTPRFSTGWYDHGSEFPQVAVFDHQEFPLGGGTSTYFAMRGDGAGPTQLRAGQVFVAGFAHREMPSITTNPKQLTWEFIREVMRIAHANVNLITDFQVLGIGNLVRVVDPERSPALFSAQVDITYQRFEEP